ncbi:septum site-determining protein Ssd [Lentzea guizhouensis]|uniref:septum site-determining protein Ssd n=1 Tax=Lentzea guizhouensis TaxID=1586287 RepID=UPI001F47E91E|nr:septum site-determining protein Ssd [Lentzea guizhouensis]
MTHPLALVTDPHLLDEVLRLAAAADCPLSCVPDVPALRLAWHAAPLVVLDAAALPSCTAADLPRRPGVVVVHGGDPPWPLVVAVGACALLELPAESDTLVALLTDVRDGPPSTQGRVISVIGGRGGAGASVLATAIARESAAAGTETLLVDCDPLGGGLDLTLGAESTAGARWPSIHCTAGRVPMSSLRTALPTPSDGSGGGKAAARPRKAAPLSVLSCDRTASPPEPQAVTAVLDAARRSGCTVVCDLPRHPTPAATAALSRTDLTVLLVPAELRATAAATRVATHLRTTGTPAHLVVRGPSPSGLTPTAIASAIGLPLLTHMRP